MCEGHLTSAVLENPFDLHPGGGQISRATLLDTERTPYFFNVTFNLGQIMAAITKGKHITGMPRLSPPDTLSEPAKAVFMHIVCNVDQAHFSEVDMPLLEAYSQSAVLSTLAGQRLDAEGAVGPDSKPSPWLGVGEKAIKQLVALSARLRICPQSRFDRLGAGANSRSQPGSPEAWGIKERKDKYSDLIAGDFP